MGTSHFSGPVNSQNGFNVPANGSQLYGTSGYSPSYAPLTVSAIGDSFVARMTTVDLNAGSGTPSAALINNSYALGVGAGVNGTHTMFSPLLHGALRSGYGWSMFEYTAGCGGATSSTICNPNNPVSLLNALYGFNTYMKNTFGSNYGKPDMCLVCAGTNDFNNNIPIATTLANLEVCYQSLLSNGIIPIAWTLTPNQLAPLQIQRLNQGILRLALKYNIPVCDAYSAVASGADGMWASTSYQFTTNDLHLSALGAGLVGYSLNQAITSYIRNSNRVMSVASNWGSIGYVTKTNSGSGYTNGTYYNVSLTGGSGSGAKATFQILSGAVSTVDINFGGTGYANGDVLSVAAGSVGGTGSGFSCTVTLSAFSNLDPNFTVYSGTINVAASYPTNWDTPAATAISTIVSPTTGTEIGTGKTPYAPSSSAIIAGSSIQNFCGNAWQLKGNGINPYNGGSYNNTTSPGDRMLFRFRIKWLPDLSQATKADCRVAVWNNNAAFDGLSGIARSGFGGNTQTCPIGGETNYPAGDFYQVFTIRAGGNKYTNFPRLDFCTTAGIFTAPAITDSLTIANVQLLNLTQLGLA